MNIYTPAEYSYMRYDLEHVLGEIGALYDVQIQSNKVACTSNMRLPDDVPWTSVHSGEYFNRIVPRIKLLHMGMYAILEVVAKNELKQNSVKAAFEFMDPLFTPFRHLNNQFKHFSIQAVPIDLLALVLLEGTQSRKLDLLFRVDERSVHFANFIVMFLTLLHTAGAISYHNRA